MSVKTADVRSLFRFASDQFLVRLGPVARIPSLNAERSIRLRDGAKLFYRLNRGDIQSIKEVYLNEVYRLPFSTKPGVLVDLGANIGMASLWLARKYGYSTIIAVEPSRSNAHLSRTNLRKNGLKAQVIEAAAGPTDGLALFEESEASNLGHIGPKGGPVKMLSMQSILGNLPDGVFVDLVKLDIEGGEEPLLSGNLEWLNRIRAIIVEFHPGIVDCPKLATILQNAGFRYIKAGTAHKDSMDCFVRAD
jgi:FkbM family methyltransferase